MALPKFFPKPVPEPPPPVEPETLDALLGVEVVYRHANAYLYPGLFEGVVQAYQVTTAGEIWLYVKSPTFTRAHWIHELQFRGYIWNVKATTAKAAVA